MAANGGAPPQMTMPDKELSRKDPKMGEFRLTVDLGGNAGLDATAMAMSGAGLFLDAANSDR